MPHSSYSQLVQAASDSALRVLSDSRVWAELDAGQPLPVEPDPPAEEGDASQPPDGEATTWRSVATLLESADRSGWPYGSVKRNLALRSGADGTQELRLRCEFTLRAGALGHLAHLCSTRGRFDSRNRGLLDELARRIRDVEWAHKATVQTLLNHKGSAVETALPSARVSELSATMRARRIGTVLIVGDDKSLLGIVSERDVVCALARDGASVLDLAAERIMSSDLVVCAPEHEVEYAMACMSDRRVRHLPVMDDGKLVGIISIGDVVRQRIETLERESRTMRDYIQAREWRYHYGAAAADQDAASHL